MHKRRSFDSGVHMLSGTEQGSKPRDNALHVVCCIETIYLPLRDATNKMFLNPTPRPSVFVHQLQDLQIELLPVRQIMVFNGLIIKNRFFA